jgi:arylsulfatase A-like enzyme
MIGLSSNPYVNKTYGFSSLFDEFQYFSTHDSLFLDGLSPYEFSERFEGSRSGKLIKITRSAVGHTHLIKSIVNVLCDSVDIDFSNKPFPKFTDDGAKAITEAAIQQADGTEPFFMFINYMDAHSPLQNTIQYDDSLHSVSNTWSSESIHNWVINKDENWTEEYFGNYRELYAASIEYLDRKVTTLIDRIDELTETETTYVITADHGNNLGYPADDRLIHHTGSMSEGLLHIPLEIVNPPEGYPERVEQLFSHLSLGELITRLAGNDSWEQQETTIVPAEHIGLAGTGDPRKYREFEPEEFAYWDRLVRCVYRDEQKYVWDSLGGQQSYRIDVDSLCWQSETDEQFDISEFENLCFDTSATEYKQQVSSEGEVHRETSEATEERLRQLGYM